LQQGSGPSQTGIAFAVMAYGLWGVTPIYWKVTQAIPAAEMLALRVLWTAVLMIAGLAAFGKLSSLRDILQDVRRLVASVLAALLLGVNWLVFIYAVQTDRILATSLGYYINPLVSVVLGLVVLRERLTRLQALAVLIAAFGIAWFTAVQGALPWIAGALAVSFGFYGLIRKLVQELPPAALAAEMLTLSPLAIAYVLWRVEQGESFVASAGPSFHLLVSAAGLVTAAPLLSFHAAARRLPLVAIGMLQYIAPSLTLGLAVWIYGEPFSVAHAVTFGCVWTGLALFTAESLRVTRAVTRGRQ
jgi:chloramphenicol-sensitive protein RarD